MINLKNKPIYNFIKSNRISVLLVALLLLIFIPPFLPSSSHFLDIYLQIDFVFIVISCYFIIHNNKISKYIAITTFLFIIVGAFFENGILEIIARFGLSIIIINAFFLVIKEAMSLNGKTENLILVSITGYLILGLIGGFFLAFIQEIYPNSFSHTANMELELYNFIYYSFVTMTTLGYGDIIPTNEKSQAVALFLTISGQLFLTIIIAMNIAKFIQKKKPMDF